MVISPQNGPLPGLRPVARTAGHHFDTLSEKFWKEFATPGQSPGYTSAIEHTATSVAEDEAINSAARRSNIRLMLQ
jgi:hypothetical protein